MKILRILDDFIIDEIFQKISNFIWKLLGINNFQVARIILPILAALEFSFTAIFFVIIFFIITIIFEKNQKIGCKNPVRYNFSTCGLKIMHIYFIFFSFLIKTDINDYIQSILIVLYLFFICCDKPEGPTFWEKSKKVFSFFKTAWSQKARDFKISLAFFMLY